MKYNFDEKIERRGSKCEKYDNLKEVFGCEDIFPAWVADTDFATPHFIMDAIAERAKHPILGYSFRDEGYFGSVMSWLERRVGWKVDRSWLEFTPGVVCGVAYAITSLSKKGDKVIIQPPVYPPFARTITANGREVVNNPLIWDGEKYQIDFENFEEALKVSKLFVLCNPHNPTGRAFTLEELTKMGELCVKYGVKIISDEIHSDLMLSGNKHIHIASISKEIADITVTYIAPSKTFNTAGLSTSVAIIPNSEIMDLYRANGDKFHVGQGNIFGAVALEAAYNNGDEWLDELLVYLDKNAQYVVDFIEENMPKIHTFKPEATFLMWLDCREMGMEHSDLFKFMLEEAKIGFNSGIAFGSEGEGFLRLNIGTTLDNVKYILSQMKSAYDKH